MRIGVIGMGYVGIPEAALFANAKSIDMVYGFQRNSETSGYKINLLNEGNLPFKDIELEEKLRAAIENKKFICTSDYSKLSECNAIIIAVQTPLPNINPFYDAIEATIAALHRPTTVTVPLIVIVSTVPPGTSRRVQAMFETQLIPVRVVHVPERVTPGKLLRNIETYPRIIGGDTDFDILLATQLYRKITKTKFITMSTVEAEITKTAENGIRAAQIAMANEIAMICEYNGANFNNVKRGIDSLKGEGVARALLEPGAGVGGHCLTKDGIHLAMGYPSPSKTHSSIFYNAVQLNKSMPYHLWDLTYDALLKSGKSPSDSRIMIFGWSYLPNTTDTRESPAILFKQIAEANVRDVIIHDPLCGYNNIDEIIRVDAIVIITVHDEIKELLSLLPHSDYPKIIIDGRNSINPTDFTRTGWVYRGIGRGDI